MPEKQNVIDLLRLSRALNQSRVGIRAVTGEDWRAQYATRFREALKSLNREASQAGRSVSVFSDLMLIDDTWEALTEANDLIRGFLATQQF